MKMPFSATAFTIGVTAVAAATLVAYSSVRTRRLEAVERMNSTFIQEKNEWKAVKDKMTERLLSQGNKISDVEEERTTWEEERKRWEQECLQLVREREALTERLHSAEQRIQVMEEEMRFWTWHVSELTLEPNTANRALSLSDGNRQVTRAREKHSYPRRKDRFDHWPQVLYREALTGRCYWEVKWSGWVSVTVAYRGINRRGRGQSSRFGLNDKSWSLECGDGQRGDRYIVRHNRERTELSVRPSDSNRVGVYLDCPAGSLSFYRVSSDTRTHLYTFQASFTEPLYPGFWLGYFDSSCCQVWPLTHHTQ